MPLTNTWRNRIRGTGSVARRALLTGGFIACSVVAVADILGWVTDKPIDVAGPARSAVNRADAVGAFAAGCVERALTATATQSQQHSLNDCWTTHDPIRLPTTPAVIIGHPRVSAVTLRDDTATAQQWSVIISVSERPYESATAHDHCYRIPVLYSEYGPRATLRPAAIDCFGPGADIPLDYPVTLADTSPAFTTIAGFITSYLTPAGGLDRWVTTGSGLLPAADYHSAKVTKLVANHAIPDHDTPADATTVRVIATVDATDSRFAPRHEDYPLTLRVTSGRWVVAALDEAPLLTKDAELSPVVPPGEPR
jgi:Conjugative transposon protein TcpC